MMRDVRKAPTTAHTLHHSTCMSGERRGAGRALRGSQELNFPLLLHIADRRKLCGSRACGPLHQQPDKHTHVLVWRSMTRDRKKSVREAIDKEGSTFSMFRNSTSSTSVLLPRRIHVREKQTTRGDNISTPPKAPARSFLSLCCLRPRVAPGRDKSNGLMVLFLFVNAH